MGFRIIVRGMVRLPPLILFASLLVYSPSSADEQAQNRQVKVGYIVDTVGVSAFFSVQSVRGAQLAEKEINDAGGNIQVLIEDCAGKPADAVTATKKLIEVDKAEALMSDLTLLSLTVSPVVAKAEKILIHQSPSRDIGVKNPNSFRNFIDYDEACASIARKWKSDHIGEVASLAPNIEFGDMCLEGIRRVYADPFAYRYNPSDDLRTAVTTFNTRKYKAVMHVGYERDFLSWFRLSSEQNYFPVQGFVEIMLSETFTSTGQTNIEGATIAGYENIPEEFIVKLNREFPSPNAVNLQGAALSYNAVHALYEAVKSCPPNDIDCQKKLLTQDPPRKLLGFRGWGSEKEYPVVLKKWTKGKLVTLTP